MDLTLPTFLLFALLVSSATASVFKPIPICNRCVHQSKAKFFGDNPRTIQTGACGYKDQAMALSWGGYVAAGNPALIKQGAGCGACYQIRCKDPKVCDARSVKVVLTDSQGEDQTAFVLSTKAFLALAKPGKEQDLKKIGNIDIEYKRVTCGYGKTMSVQVEDGSSPYYLAFKFLYQGDQTNIFGAAVASAGSNSRVSLNRRYGSAVWEYNGKVPAGPLDIHVQVASGLSTRWVTAKKALPFGWKSGFIYNTGVLIKDIVQERCYTCVPTDWPLKN